ncbi:MAG TPA: vanadium-dependent haloperoxidase, partial [Gemmatimonadaceae bacterium]|nr:vanadium-dependent haloperoxidase [Gemmatimonadaceae bacterium]
FRTFKGHRALAMLHIAMHDAVNGVRPRYRQYAFFGRDSLADPAVAAAQAAHDVLAAEYPGAAAVIDAKLAGRVASTGDGSAARGAELGRRAAAAILEKRRGDGVDVMGTYSFRKTAGAYATTPPWNGFVAWPGFRYARPFALTSPSQLRPPPPPALERREYAKALNEVKQVGGAKSTSRSADQTGYAVWWMEYVEGSVNRLARRLAQEKRLPLAEAARLFALLNVAIFDDYVAVWDSKFEYDHWRPYTAIREAARADSSWQPLRPTPPFPEYVSAHAGACAASFAILERFLGDQPFTMETTTAPAGMPTRRFASFRDAAAECADSRVRLGWHFRYATDAGLELGRAVAEYVGSHYFTAVSGRGSSTR